MRRLLLERFTKILEIFLLLAGVGQAARRGGFIWSIVTYLNKIVHDSQVKFFWILLFYTSLTNIVNILYLPAQATTHRQEEILCSFLACQ